ncbi:endoplasmic reticulum junction formation protein lunapark [Bufo gargarizans]|uniref:endoplasmic reticulum junction formation protein lunapark n=1 Tax=Bufo gargarizans TaxID=30331 RepID=UPI001CF45135|nr:endoplasmic reticulum junction formation protein lunapark [Bufo gargarizans]XP_044128293.1 endoplasmic reticulum junction formation protein lunapark [Bufo gargarizans]XP_044128294.1 endoplasmic reticulum junction formation protein lunapark [Bufo gargarizans]
MGALLSRWKAKPSTVQVLEKMEKEVQSLEEFQEKNQKLRKIWVGRLLVYSAFLYFLTCLIVYLWYLPDGLTARLVIIIPFLLFPVIIWFARTLLIIWFSKRTERNNEALEDLKAQKKKILEEVMETETYKAAKLILERFDPDSRKIKELESPAGVPSTPKPGQDLRQRTAAQRNISVSTPVNPSQGTPQVPGMLAATPGLQRDTSAPGGPPERTVQPGLQSGLVPRRPGSPAISGMAVYPPGPPLARPILPRERGAVDRVIEYLVGDGPQNRYALICQQCFSHNGMALKEEFEYVAFRCAYCFFLNPARKTRPQAPRLQEFNLERLPRPDSLSSTSLLQAATEELEIQTSSDPSEAGETPDAEEVVEGEEPSEAGETPDAKEVVEEEEKCTEELSDETVKEVGQALPEEIVKPPNVNESEESLMETE